jgi:hypothetical protein
VVLRNVTAHFRLLLLGNSETLLRKHFTNSRFISSILSVATATVLYMPQHQNKATRAADSFFTPWLQRIMPRRSVVASHAADTV